MKTNIITTSKNLNKENMTDARKRKLDYSKSLKNKLNESMMNIEPRKDLSLMKKSINTKETRKSVSPIAAKSNTKAKADQTPIKDCVSILVTNPIAECIQEQSSENSNQLKTLTEEFEACYELYKENSEAWKAKFEELFSKNFEHQAGANVPTSFSVESDKVMSTEIFWILWLSYRKPEIELGDFIATLNNCFNFVNSEVTRIKAFYLLSIKAYEKEKLISYLKERNFNYTEDEMYLNSFLFSLLDNYAEFYLSSKMKKARISKPPRESFKIGSINMAFEAKEKLLPEVINNEGFTIENSNKCVPLNDTAKDISSEATTKTFINNTNLSIDTSAWFNIKSKSKLKLIPSNFEILPNTGSALVNERESVVVKEELNDSVDDEKINTFKSIKPTTEKKLNESSRSVRRRNSEVNIEYPYDMIEPTGRFSKVLHELENHSNNINN
jgi:hypothetical protein